MKTLQVHFARFWQLYTLGIADALILVLARVYLVPVGKPFDWPSWAQAIGSISAILVAIWVSADQSRQQRLRDEEHARAEIVGTVRSLLAELQTTLTYLDSQVAPVLAEKTAGQPIRTTFSLPEYPFPIFDGLIPRLGTISNGDLLSKIVNTFGYAKSLAITIGTHTKLVDALSFAEAQHRFNPAADPYAAARVFAAVDEYDQKLLDAYSIARKEIDELVLRLDEVIQAEST